MHVTVLSDDRDQCLMMQLTWHLENGATSTSIRLCVETWHEECKQLLAWDGDAERREDEEPRRSRAFAARSAGIDVRLTICALTILRSTVGRSPRRQP
jgi:hypothetical protein